MEQAEQMLYPNASTVSDEIPQNWTEGRHLGSGGFGDVYVLKDPDNPLVERFVYKKVIKSKAPKDRDDNIVELDVLRRLSHERIVPFYGYKEDVTSIFIFMGLMPQGSLHDHIADNGALPEEKIVLFTSQILEGVSYLHNQRPKIVHRDIKSHNILIQDDTHVVLTDFGVSKVLHSFTYLKTSQGTGHWMAPEVVQASSSYIYDEKADVWSIGCTVVEMATTSPPFSEFKEYMQICYQLLSQAPPIKYLPADCPTHLVNFLTRIFKYKPADRPSVDELLKDRFITGIQDVADASRVDGVCEKPMVVEGIQDVADASRVDGFCEKPMVVEDVEVANVPPVKILNYIPQGIQDVADASRVDGVCEKPMVVEDVEVANVPPVKILNYIPQDKPIRGRLKADDEAKIKKIWTKLLEEVDGGHLVPHLYQNCIISLDDVNQVESETTRRKRAEVLLYLVMFAGPRAAFHVFVESLQENYPHLADILLASP